MGLLPQPYDGPPLQHRPGTLKWNVPTNILREEQMHTKENERMEEFKELLKIRK